MRLARWRGRRRSRLGASRARVLRDVLVDALMLLVLGIGVRLLAAVLWVRVADPRAARGRDAANRRD